MIPGTKAAQKDKEEEVKSFAQRQMNKKLDFLRLREPCDFPNIEYGVSDKDFVAVVERFQKVYDSAHSLNQVYQKYQQAIPSNKTLLCLYFVIDLVISNHGLKLSASKAYS